MLFQGLYMKTNTLVKRLPVKPKLIHNKKGQVIFICPLVYLSDGILFKMIAHFYSQHIINIVIAVVIILNTYINTVSEFKTH